MKRARSIRATAAFMVTALMTSCTAAPVTSYRLASEPGPIEHIAPLTISIRSISIPDYLAQGNVPKPVSPFIVGSFPNDTWAGSFSDMLQTTMTEDLAQRLNGATVIDSDGSIETPSNLQIEINVLRFGPSTAGDIELTMQVALKAGPNRRLLSVRTINRRLASGPTASDIVAAMSALWASAANQIATSVAHTAMRLPRKEAAAF